MNRKLIPQEALINLRKQLDSFPLKSPGRSALIEEMSKLYGVTPSTIYRQLSRSSRPNLVSRKDRGKPRNIDKEEMLKYCEIIAAIKIRNSNKKDRHVSTASAILLLESGIQHGKETIKAPKGLLKRATVNRFLAQLGLDKMGLDLQKPVTRFQAKYSNECWQFDLSQSDLKYIEIMPEWVDPKHGKAILMLYSVVDDRSGVSYQEYHVVYGEDVIAALMFLFNAMSKKENENFPFQGIPKVIYMDNGPIAKSAIFQRAMQNLGIELRCHMPRNSDGRRVTARSKGKVERPFRTVKELHETLYHFHKPKDEKEANKWLFPFLIRYSQMPHRSQGCSRIEDWIKNIPEEGIRQMCSWERFSSLVREPVERTVNSDCTISLDGIIYSVDHELMGKTVIVWNGLLETDIFIEFEGAKYGPFQQSGYPLQLNKYRSYKKTEAERRIDKIEKIANELSIPRETMDTIHLPANNENKSLPSETIRMRPFVDPDPFNEIRFPSEYAARKFIAHTIGIPLGKLPLEKLNDLHSFLSKTLEKAKILEWIQQELNLRQESS